ncbi:Fn3 domain-containing protein [Pontimonas salivibrio]|uniref:Fn3 domain-containing protein n=1 Tax=Pontimonas salivibrio TaxID=1159327 RepID=A0A2L2BPJ9_9MICO|nr:fibronectin type III domain-containing protein [Pontimonas salivibrio]AVG23542.1 Fn3 domain-containing protein [Pontimonas salivibrio]
MRRILAATLIGVLTGSLLTTLGPHATPSAYAAVTVDGCSVDVSVDGTALTSAAIGDPDDSPTHVEVTKVGNDCVLTFIKPSEEMVWTIPNHVGEFEALVIAGGGGGGLAGGGAGGYYDTYGSATDGSGDSGSVTVPTGSTTAKIFVGDGGVGGTPTTGGRNGADSALIFDSDDGYADLTDVYKLSDQLLGSRTPQPTVSSTRIVMAGGGGGAHEQQEGSDGGSGGGSGASNKNAGLSVTPPGDGNTGGVGSDDPDNSSAYYGGGGGGAGQVGGNADSSFGSFGKGGDGGDGEQSGISGSVVYRAGGGGGGYQSGSGSDAATGGQGGGGDAETTNGNEHGDDRTGGGGGGASNASETAGDGGSGVVIVRFAPPPVDPAPVLGSVTRTAGGFTAEITNFDAVNAVADSFSESVTNGSVTRSGSTVTVSSLSAGQSSELTVSVSASGLSDASASVTGVAKASQAELVFPASLYSDSSAPVLSAVFGESVPVSVVGGSGTGDVRYTDVSGPCLVSSSGLVRLTGVGECVVTAVRAGDENFLSETVQDFLKITSNKAPQFVSFTSSVPADPVVGDTYTPTAVATGSGSVSFAVSGACSIASGVVTFTSASTCTITASSGSDTNYLAATAVTQVIEVGLANQTITFDAVGDKDFDDRPFQLSASSSRGLDVSFATSSAACSVTSAGVVSIDATGLCEITASQDGVDGQVAEASKVVRSFRVQAVVPGAPRLTSVGFGNGSLTVGFIAPDYVGGGTISAYRAVATDGDGNEFVNNSCDTTSPCTVSGLTNGTEYSVTVAAVNEAGVGPVSNVSPATAPADRAQAVSGLSTVPGDGVLDVTWDQPSNTTELGGGNFTRYDVSIRPTGGSYGTAVTPDGTNNLTTLATNSYQFTGLTNGTGYDVKVEAITDANSSQLVGRTAETSGVPAVAPSVVRDVEAVLVGNTGTFVSWAAPASDGGLPVTSYEVTPESLSCEFDNPTDQFCEITGLARGRTVSISVAGVNGIGAGETVTVSVSTPALPSSGGGDDDDEATPVPTVGPTAGPAVPGRPGVPGGVPGRPGGGIPGGVTPGGGTPPPPPGGTAGSPVTPERPGATVGGVPVPTTTTASPGGRGVSVSAGGVDVGVDVPDGGDGAGGVIDRGGTPEPVVTPGQGKTVSGAGAAPGSVVDVWLPGRGGNAPTNIAQIPVGEDGTFSADVDVFAGSGEPLPIGRNVVQIVTTNAEGETIVVDMPFTLTQGQPTPEVLRSTGETPNAPAVGIINTNKGDPTVTRVMSVPDRGIVSVESDTWAFTVGINTTRGVVEGADTDTVIRTTSNTEVTVSGSGFMADTRVDVWAFSTPTLLGNATVDSDGTVSVTVTVTPQSLEVGAHTLQLQAVGQDGFIRTSNLPIEIQDTPASLTTGDSAGTLLWWTVSIAAAIIVLALLVAYLLRRRQRA